MDINKMPELLSPAGSIESLYAAVSNGCDAIYFGGKNFSARSYASNFSIEDMKEAVEYCKLRGVKTYLTLNTLIKEKEIKDVYDYLKQVYSIGIDALILQDIGVVKLVKEYFPQLEIHASTQMTAHSLQDVKYLKELGFSRVVLSRELSLIDIKEIKDNCDIEIETFIHGALCYSYSGQCLMSSFIGGRSGNRGRCAQPCRLPYNLMKGTNKLYKKDKYLLSLKDIETLEIIPQMVEAGIDSLKIEGRMKRPEYVAGVTYYYRKYLDLCKNSKELYKVDKQDLEDIKQLFNRGGFSKGYYLNKHNMIYNENPKNAGVKVGQVIGINKNSVKIKFTKALNQGDGIEILTDQQPHPGTMIKKHISNGQVLTLNLKGKINVGHEVYRTKDVNLIKRFNKNSMDNDRKKDISAKIIVKTDEKVFLSLKCDDKYVNVEGPIIEKSINNPTESERIIKQISKLGNTPFRLGKIEADIDNNVFVPMSTLNQLRRDAVEKLVDVLLDRENNEVKPFERREEKKDVQEKKITIHLSNFKQLNAIEESNISKVYIELTNFNINELKQSIKIARRNNFEIFIALPYILKSNYYDELEQIESLEFDGYLVRNLGQLYWCKKNSKKKYVIDYTLNTYNNLAVSNWINEGADKITASVELNNNEINMLHNNNYIEYYAYGSIPVMITEQCLVKDINNACKAKENGLFYLKDRMNNLFPVERVCKYCYTKIYNISPIYLLNQYKELMDLPVDSYRLSFLDESEEEIKSIIKGYEHVILNKKSIDSIEKEVKQVLEKIQMKGFTKGHFTRGVE